MAKIATEVLILVPYLRLRGKMVRVELMSRAVFLVIFSLSSLLAFTQKGNLDKAEDYYKKKNYAAAIGEYKKLLSKDSLSYALNYKLGLCYLYSNIDKKQAVYYMQRASSSPEREPEILYDLARAHISLMQYDFAEKKLIHYREMCSEKEYGKVEELMRTIEAARLLMKTPVDCEIEDLGENINSTYPDYYPFMSKDGKRIVFTSRREANLGTRVEFDGFYSSDIWISDYVDGQFQKAVNAGKRVNTYLDEQCVGISDDGEALYVYIDHIDEFGDIYTCKELPTGEFSGRRKLGLNVNSKKLETSCSISSDGQTLFFASERDGSLGGRDLFMSRKLPSGAWGKPQNLGPTVNTEFNEDFPTLSNDNKTLYFSSDGHAGMGGYDLYYSTWDPDKNTWTAPKNVGYPINTPGDNRTISFDEDGSHAVVSDYWQGKSRGDFDIYMIKFENQQENFATFMLSLDGPAGMDVVAQNTQIDLFDEYEELVASFRPNKNSGNFLVVINPGVYQISITADGMDEYFDDFVVTNQDAEQPMVFRTISINK